MLISYRNVMAASRAGAMLLIVIATQLGGCDAFKSPEARVERARAALAKGEYSAAMRDLKTALESEPGHAEGRRLLAELSLQVGDAAGARKELDRAVQAGIDPGKVAELRYDILLAAAAFDEAESALQAEQDLSEARRLTYLASALAGLGRHAEAGTALAAALELDPNDPRILVEQAQVLMAQGRDDDAAEAVGKALALDGRSGRALLTQGLVGVRRADFRTARTAFDEALGLGPAALTFPERIIGTVGRTEADLMLGDLDAAAASLAELRGLAPNAAVTHYVSGRLNASRADHTAAVSDLRRAASLSPDHQPTRLLLGAILLSQGSTEQAEAEIERVLAADPTSVEARKLMAMVQLARNDPVAAARALQSVTSGDGGGDAQVDRLMGAALVRSGSTEEGIGFLERSVAAKPDDPTLRLDLAEAYLAAGRPAAAEALIRDLPEDVAPDRRRALLVFAATQGKPRGEAMAAVEELVAQHDADAEFLRVAGAYFTAVGERDRGLDLLRRSAQSDPRNVRTRLALALAEAQAGDAAAAQAGLEAVLELEPANQRAHLWLARLALAQGDVPAAMHRLERAISADPSAIEARLQLSQLALARDDDERGRALLDQAVEAGGQQPRVINAVGESLLRSGDEAGALERFVVAFEAGLPEAGLNAARTQVSLERYDEARRTLATLLGMRPAWPPAVALLAMLDVQDGRADEGIRRVEALRQAGVRGPIVDELVGDLRLRAKQWSEADRAYDAAVAGEPSARLAIKRHAARHQGKLADVDQPLVDWLERAPDDIAVRMALAESHMRQARYADAIADYERIAARTPRDPVVLNNLAWVYQQAGDSRALETAHKAHEIAPERADVADTYGWILVQQGQARAGLPILENAARVSGGDPEILYHLAAAYARDNQRQKAADTLSPLLASGKPFPARADAERLLASLTD